MSDLPVLQRSLLDWFAPFEAVSVAYSGGVDSALVLAAAVRALGPESVHAITARSPALPQGAWEAASDLAAGLGVRHTGVVTDELSSPGYRANGADRCYFCKSTLVDAITAISDVAASAIVTGTNADDVAAGWRPGIRAAAERGARTPLADVGLTKAQVRAVSRAWRLPAWDRPASPCLSSRIAYGVPISATRLARVDEAERGVRASLGRGGVATTNLRVRDLGDAVRIEVDADQVEATEQLPDLRAALDAAGFDGAEVTVTGFRSGAMNAVLPEGLRFT